MLAQRHEVVAVRLWDAREVGLVDAGVVVLQDSETGEQLLVDTSDPRVPASVPGSRRGARRAAAQRHPPRRRRPLRPVHRRRHRPRAVADGLLPEAARAPMTFLAPGALAFLLLVPVLVVGYVWIVRRRTANEDELGTMARSATRSGKPLGWRRHVPPALFLVGVVVLLVGLARPEATVDLPRREGTVILAFDVSSSMKAKDLKPNRLVAAKQAARAFVADQPSSIRIGVVAFSDAGYVVQAPARSHDEVLAAIDRLSPRGGTALGRGDPHVAGCGGGRAARPRPDCTGERRPATRGPLPGLGCGRPALRRRQHRGPRPAGPGLGRRPGRRAHLPDRDRQPERRGGRHRRLPGRDRARRQPAARGRQAERWHLLQRRATPPPCARSTTASTSSSPSPAARPRSPPSSPPAGCLLFLAAAGLSMRWYGRVI